MAKIIRTLKLDCQTVFVPLKKAIQIKENVSNSRIPAPFLFTFQLIIHLQERRRFAISESFYEKLRSKLFQFMLRTKHLHLFCT